MPHPNGKRGCVSKKWASAVRVHDPPKKSGDRAPGRRNHAIPAEFANSASVPWHHHAAGAVLREAEHEPKQTLGRSPWAPNGRRARPDDAPSDDPQPRKGASCASPRTSPAPRRGACPEFTRASECNTLCSRNLKNSVREQHTCCHSASTWRGPPVVIPRAHGGGLLLSFREHMAGAKLSPARAGPAKPPRPDRPRARQAGPATGQACRARGGGGGGAAVRAHVFRRP